MVSRDERSAKGIGEALRRHLLANPGEALALLRKAVGLRVGVPLMALDWLGEQWVAAGKLESFRVDAAPPGIRVEVTLRAMRTPIRARLDLFVDGVRFGEDELAIELRIEGVQVSLTGDSSSPIAQMLRGGGLDLTRPATLIGNLPGLPAVVVEAEGSRVVLDLMRDPRLAELGWQRRVIALLTSFLTLHGVEADARHLDLVLRALPRGLGGGVGAVSRHLVTPTVTWMLAGGVFRGGARRR